MGGDFAVGNTIIVADSDLAPYEASTRRKRRSGVRVQLRCTQQWAGREAHTARRVLPDHVELAVVQVAVCRYRLVRRALCVEILGARVVAPLPTVQDQLSVPKVGRLS